MVKKILIWIIPVLALVGGAFGGDMLSSRAEAPAGTSEGGAPEEGDDHAAAEAEHAAGEDEAAEEHDSEAKSGGGHGSGGDETAAAWFSFPNQFFVPLVRRGEIEGMMVITLSIETTQLDLPEIEAQEHRLRDALLRTLIVHANTGGFAGNYTSEAKLQRLRDALFAAATKATGPEVHAVLIEDIGQTGT